jgi:hypothetical protein
MQLQDKAHVTTSTAVTLGLVRLVVAQYDDRHAHKTGAR